MPICTYTFPEFIRVDQEGLDAAVSTCKSALRLLLNHLNIPDWDQEVRVVYGQEPGLSIKFTVGGEEYPNEHPGEEFNPSEEEIRAAGQEIIKEIGDVPLRIETFANSAFMPLSPEGSSPSDERMPSVQELDGAAENSTVDINLYLSVGQTEQLRSSHRSGGKEGASSGEDEQLNRLGEKLAQTVLESVGGTTERITLKRHETVSADAPAALEITIKDGVAHDPDGLIALALEITGKFAPAVEGHESNSVWVMQDSGRKVYSF